MEAQRVSSVTKRASRRAPGRLVSTGVSIRGGDGGAIRNILCRKLRSVVAGGGLVAVTVAAVGFAWFDVHRYWDHARTEVTAIGGVVADRMGPAMASGDLQAAGATLQAVRNDSLIRSALLYDAAGGCVASFHRDASFGCRSARPAEIKRISSEWIVTRPVITGKERVGTLVLSAGIPSLGAFLFRYLAGAALVVGLSLVVAAITAMALQARVSNRVLEIAAVADRIRTTHQFGDRVSGVAFDELGQLANSFNAMLDEIGRRDAEVMQHRRSLEEEVAERTRVNAELRVAKEKAEEAARIKTEFLANMSHEIRTPMNGVMGMISLVLDRCQVPEEREQLLVAQTAAQSLVLLLNDILDLSKMEAGRMTIEAIGFELPALLREVLRMFEVAARQKGLPLGLDVSPWCPAWVCGDPLRLRQVLVNLIGNAVKFTERGSVQVTVSQHAAGSIRFEVRDTGIGVHPEKLEAVFEAFTQADGSHTRQFGGTGLGLTITRRLVHLMKGRLWAESEVGCGSRFYVELPMEAAEPVQAPQPIPAKAPCLPGLEVLVAEDNAVNQRVILSMLRRQGWSITLAQNGVEAYRRFLESRFDVILMDVQMPEMDGYEATRLIREEERSRGTNGPGRRTPIIALTAHASQSEHEQCLAAGMDKVITKPVRLEALVEGINEYLAEVAVSDQRSAISSSEAHVPIGAES